MGDEPEDSYRSESGEAMVWMKEGRRYTSERGPEGHPERWTHFILLYLSNKGGGLRSEVVALLAEVYHTNDRLCSLNHMCQAMVVIAQADSSTRLRISL